MATFRTFHTRVFAASPEGGNPCPVVVSSVELPEEEMLSLAKEYGLDTAFIVGSSRPQSTLPIRYFVPDHEMGVSGHATVAAITVACHLHLVVRPNITVETISGSFDVNCENVSGPLIVTLEQRAPEFGLVGDRIRIATALGSPPDGIDDSCGPIQAVSVSRAKMLVPLRSRDLLDALRPNFENLWQYCEQFEVTGFYPFTRDRPRFGASVEARQFPYRAGFPEDAATGVAAAALGAYLTRYQGSCADGIHEFVIAQGFKMGAASRIPVSARCEHRQILETSIRGSATVVAEQ